MKKKIIDLTAEEAKKICDKYDSCDECPLYIGVFCPFCIADLITGFKKYANREIEIEEE